MELYLRTSQIMNKGNLRPVVVNVYEFGQNYNTLQLMHCIKQLTACSIQTESQRMKVMLKTDIIKTLKEVMETR